MLSAIAAIADEKTANKLIACESDPRFSDFEFWIGEWRVTDRVTGSYAGDNSITRVGRNCALQESWRSGGGGVGVSLNYFNPATGKWRQIWVAGPGYVIEIDGGLVDGSMILVGTITTFTDKIAHPFRGTWTANADGTVRQFFEQYSEKEKTWQTWFDGIYTRRD